MRVEPGIIFPLAPPPTWHRTPLAPPGASGPGIDTMRIGSEFIWEKSRIEAIVLRHASRFEPHVVEAARRRLAHYGVDPAKVGQR